MNETFLSPLFAQWVSPEVKCTDATVVPFAIVEVCERLFNLLPVICDTITLIYVEQPFGILYIRASEYFEI